MLQGRNATVSIQRVCRGSSVDSLSSTTRKAVLSDCGIFWQLGGPEAANIRREPPTEVSADVQVMKPQAESESFGGNDPGSRYPGGCRFAFTILDDTDDATVANVKPLYDLLFELGYRTTKTVWPVACPEGSRIYFAGHTLQEPGYAEFARELLERGFEVAFHGATMESSERGRTLRALDILRDELGVEPRIHCNHGQNRENLYWGPNRYRAWPLRRAASIGRRLWGGQTYSGEVEKSRYFWGDICRARIRYVRSFAFATLNTASLPVHGPYRTRNTPYVNYWFTTSDAPDAAAFRNLVTREAVDVLAESRGYCILSTHLGKGFVKNGQVDGTVADVLRYMAGLGGWFVPASELLDHLMEQHPPTELSPWRQFSLESAHVIDRLRSRARKSR